MIIDSNPSPAAHCAMMEPELLTWGGCKRLLSLQRGKKAFLVLFFNCEDQIEKITEETSVSQGVEV